MNVITFFLLALVLDQSTGEEVSRHINSGPYEELGDCVTAQLAKEPTKPADGKIVVYQCAVVRGPRKAG